MGMFDYIRCDAPLPDGWQPKGPLQTKDFDCELVTHVITADGRLMLDRIDSSEWLPQSEGPYPDAPPDSLLSMAGRLRQTKSLHESKFHGWLNFYGSEGDINTIREPNSDYRWHEYRAKFTDGRLVEIVAVPEDPA